MIVECTCIKTLSVGGVTIFNKGEQWSYIPCFYFKSPYMILFKGGRDHWLSVREFEEYFETEEEQWEDISD